MKASLEKVPQRVGVSWRLKQIVDREKDFSWHYHNKEFELMLHRNFHSRCHIGHYHGELEPLSMILIAPNTPHAIQAIETNNNEDFETIVIWFKQDWIANMMFSCHELRKIDVLLKRAQKGFYSTNKLQTMWLLLLMILSQLITTLSSYYHNYLRFLPFYVRIKPAKRFSLTTLIMKS